MRNRSLDITLVLAIVLSCSPATSGQNNQPSRPAKAPHSGQTPDFSGVWMLDHPPATSDQYWLYQFNAEEPPMTAWGKAKFASAKSSFGPHSYPIAETNDPFYHGCFPAGVPRVFLDPWPMQIVQAPGEVIMLFENDSLRRQIFTDDQPHETRFGPSWMGDSIGHWEGETLVVDTVNFNDKTWLDRVGHPHSDALHLTERLRRINHDHLLDDITIEDPKAYTKPWTAHLDLLLRPGWKLMEQFCEDGESFQDLDKKEEAPGK